MKSAAATATPRPSQAEKPEAPKTAKTASRPAAAELRKPVAKPAPAAKATKAANDPAPPAADAAARSAPAPASSPEKVAAAVPPAAAPGPVVPGLVAAGPAVVPAAAVPVAPPVGTLVATPVTAPAAAPRPGGSPMPHTQMRPGMMQNGRPVQVSRDSGKDEVFAQGDYVVYPTHGVGKVERIAAESIVGQTLELIHITFEENRMTLRVPVSKARSAGLRKLATRPMFDDAMNVLRGRARIKRTMWSRRAQEYEAKINSGDPIAIAEVVRDLHRNSGQPDQSFSERQIYEAALDRMAAELGALEQIDKLAATAKLTAFLKELSSKAPPKEEKDGEASDKDD